MKAAGSRRDRIRAQLADLKMPGALEAVDDVLTRVDGGGVTASEAIEQLLGAQIMLRNNRRLQAAMRSSRLPAIKTLDDFDFSFQPSIKREQIDSLHELGFLARNENVIFLGPPGVGKTPLAISLAIAAAQSGRRVYYGALADLITSLEEAKTAGQLGRRLKILTYPSLLVIDEIGYLPVQPDRRHALLPTHQPALRARIHRAHVQQRVRRVGSELGRRSHGRCTHRSLATPLSYRQHTWQQLPHAQAHRPFQDPTLASCGAEPFTPQEKESKSKGEVDELEARHLRRV